MIYLASPYSHPDPTVRTARFEAACHAAAMLLKSGHAVYSPIVHSHPMVQYGLPTNWEFWETVDRRHLETCDELAVLKLDGWHESRGVEAEIRITRELGKPIWYLDPPLATTSPSLAPVATGTEIRT